MAKIRNSGMKNLHGDGNVKIFTYNNGKEYTISNTGMKNLHGDGYVQKVEERGSTSEGIIGIIFDLLPNFIKVPIILLLCGVVIYTLWDYIPFIFWLLKKMIGL